MRAEADDPEFQLRFADPPPRAIHHAQARCASRAAPEQRAAQPVSRSRRAECWLASRELGRPLALDRRALTELLPTCFQASLAKEQGRNMRLAWCCQRGA